MPRGSDDSMESELRPLVERFTAQLARMIEDHVQRTVRRRVLDEVRKRLGKPMRAPRGTAQCYYPGCTNIAAPRFGMFCAAKHKDLPATEKARIRARREKSLTA